MHGGVKFYSGNPAPARAYLESGHSRADDYYLAEGSGVATLYAASPRPGAAAVDQACVVQVGVLEPAAYERWVHGYDATTGESKGVISEKDNALRFVEVTVNGPKTWSLAAAVHPGIAAAYDAAQGRAAREVIGWLAGHATTRVWDKDLKCQVQVPVEAGLEAVVIRHYTSRAGDPHRHLHLQIHAKIQAAGTWYALHSVGVRDSVEAINGIGHAAVMCDPEFRASLAAHGYTLDADGEVDQLAPYAGRFSQRAAQIGRNVDRYEAAWRGSHPGQEPGPRLRRTWDRRAWADARPDKVVPADGADLVAAWNAELTDLGFTPPTTPTVEPASTPGLPIGRLNRDVAADLVVTRLGAKRSAWNSADIRGQVEVLVASVGVIAETGVRSELVEDIAARARARCVPLLERGDVPDHVRALTSPRVLAVEADLLRTLAARAAQPVVEADWLAGTRLFGRLDAAQQRVVTALAGTAGLLVIEGAAGTGKTTTLSAARDALEVTDRRLVVVTPTLKAAQAAKQEAGVEAFSAAWLIHQHGYRWDTDGHRTRVDTETGPVPLARLLPGDVLLCDEAGMLDQDTAHALVAIADQANATLALLGDRHQLPAVGRGGVLDLGARWVHPTGHRELDAVHRFGDTAYADLSLLMRTGEQPGEVFDTLLARGQIVLHASEIERTTTLAGLAATAFDGETARGKSNQDGKGGQLVVADTREQVAALNAAIRDHRHRPDNQCGAPTDERAGERAGERSGERSGEWSGEWSGVVTRGGERIGVGDRVATRRNDPTLHVANRDTWTVTGIGDHREPGSLIITGRAGQRMLPAEYVHRHVELAYATTAYGAQGETVDSAHLVLGDTTGAAAAYVGMTRGRRHNTAHLVATSIEEARAQWVTTFSRDRADLGPGHAATQAAADIDRYGPHTPDPGLAAIPFS